MRTRLKEFLKPEEKSIFAYIHGSFNDLDRAKILNAFGYEMDLCFPFARVAYRAPTNNMECTGETLARGLVRMVRFRPFLNFVRENTGDFEAFGESISTFLRRQ
ncbi:MAG: hypothetical protein RMK30_05655 [Anaerolineae bacterium]|nr:hypothetical protein [Anaerolineae bacterium]MDW8102343.1 hypothetical protein [Anaerolineae bacterium]